jgi:DNA-binding LytR/AlgR family response regulator
LLCACSFPKVKTMSAHRSTSTEQTLRKNPAKAIKTLLQDRGTDNAARARNWGIVGAPSRPSLQRTIFKSGTRRIFVDLSDLQWVEAERDYAILHVRTERHLIRATMATLEAKLPSGDFCRIHRSTIINIGYIREIRNDAWGRPVVILQNGAELKVGRSYYKKLLSWLSEKEMTAAQDAEELRPSLQVVRGISGPSEAPHTPMIR